MGILKSLSPGEYHITLIAPETFTTFTPLLPCESNPFLIPQPLLHLPSPPSSTARSQKQASVGISQQKSRRVINATRSIKPRNNQGSAIRSPRRNPRPSLAAGLPPVWHLHDVTWDPHPFDAVLPRLGCWRCRPFGVKSLCGMRTLESLCDMRILESL